MNSLEVEPPNYDDVAFPHNFIMNNYAGRISRYVFRKGVHIILLKTGELYVLGEGNVHLKDRLVKISSRREFLISSDVAIFEGYYYYNYNGKKQEKFYIYGKDGKLILSPGKNNVCILL